jgi:hypothetical protein
LCAWALRTETVSLAAYATRVSLHSQAAFVADDVSNIIKESVDAVLQNQQYNEVKVRGRCHVQKAFSMLLTAKAALHRLRSANGRPRA